MFSLKEELRLQPKTARYATDCFFSLAGNVAIARGLDCRIAYGTKLSVEAKFGVRRIWA